MPNTNTPLLLQWIQQQQQRNNVFTGSVVDAYVKSYNRTKQRLSNIGKSTRAPYRAPSLSRRNAEATKILIDESPFIKNDQKDQLKRNIDRLQQEQETDYAASILYNTTKDKNLAKQRMVDLYSKTMNGDYFDRDMIIQDEEDRIAKQVDANMTELEQQQAEDQQKQDTENLQDSLIRQDYLRWIKEEHPGLNPNNPIAKLWWGIFVDGGRSAINKFAANSIQATRDGVGGRYETADIISNIVNYEIEYQKAKKQLDDIDVQLRQLGYGTVSYKTPQQKQRINELYNQQTVVANKVNMLQDAHNYYMQAYLYGGDLGNAGLLGRAKEDATQTLKMLSNNLKHLGVTDEDITYNEYQKQSAQQYQNWKKQNPSLTYDEYLNKQALNVKKHAEYAKKIYKSDYDWWDKYLIDFKNKNRVSKWYDVGEQLHQDDSILNPEYWFYVQPGMIGTSSDVNQLISQAIQVGTTATGAVAGGVTGGVPGAVAGGTLGWNIANVASLPSNLSAGYNENFMEALQKRTDNLQVLMKLPENGGEDGYNAVISDLRQKYEQYLKRNGARPSQIYNVIQDDNAVLQAAALGQITSNLPQFRKAYVDSMRGLEKLRMEDNIRTMYGDYFEMQLSMLPIGGKLKNLVGGQIRNKIIDKTAAGRALTGLYDKGASYVENKIQHIATENGLSKLAGTQSARLAEKTGANDIAKERIYKNLWSNRVKQHISAFKSLNAAAGTGALGQLAAVGEGAITGTLSTVAHNMYGHLGRALYRTAAGNLIRNHTAGAEALKWLFSKGKSIANSKLLSLGLPIAKVAAINGITEGTEEGVQYLNSQYDVTKAGWDAPDPNSFSDMFNTFWKDTQQGLRVTQAYLSLLGIGDSPLKNDQEFWNNVKGGFTLGLGRPVIAKVYDQVHNAVVEHNIAEKLGLDGVINREGARADRTANRNIARQAIRGNEQHVINVITERWKQDRQRGDQRTFTDSEWQEKLDDARRTMALAKDDTTRTNLEKVGIKYGSEEYNTAISLISDAHKQLNENRKAVGQLNGDFDAMIGNKTVMSAVQQHADELFEQIQGSRSYKENRKKAIEIAQRETPNISAKEAGEQYDARLKSGILNATRTSVDASYRVLAIANAIKRGNTAKQYLDTLKNQFGIVVDAHDAPTMMRSLRRQLTSAIEEANERIGKTGKHFSTSGDIDTLINQARSKIEKVTQVDDDAISNGVASAMLQAHSNLYSNFIQLLQDEADLKDLEEINKKRDKAEAKQAKKNKDKKDVLGKDGMPEFSLGHHWTEQDEERYEDYEISNRHNYHHGRFKTLVQKYIQTEKENDGLQALAGDYLDGSLNVDGTSKLDTAFTKERQADLDVAAIENKRRNEYIGKRLERLALKAKIKQIVENGGKVTEKENEKAQPKPEREPQSNNKKRAQLRQRAKTRRNKQKGYSKLVDNDLQLHHSYTANELYDILVKHVNNPAERTLLYNVTKVAQKLGLIIRFGDTRSKTHIGSYSGRTINISYNASLRENQSDFLHVVLHEMLHGVTAYVIDAYQKGTLESVKLKHAAQNLISAFEQAKGNKNVSDKFKYATSDIYEFIAEFANSQFRDTLSKIVSRDQTSSLWDKIKQAIRSIFVKSKTLEETIGDSINDILDNYDEDSFDRYAVSNSDIHYLELVEDDKYAVDALAQNILGSAKNHNSELTFPRFLRDVQESLKNMLAITSREIEIADIINRLQDLYQRARTSANNVFVSDDDVIQQYVDAFLGKQEQKETKKTEIILKPTAPKREGHPIQEQLNERASHIDQTASRWGCIIVKDGDKQIPYPNIDFINALKDERLKGKVISIERQLIAALIEENATKDSVVDTISTFGKFILDIPEIKDIIENHIGEEDWAYYAAAVLDRKIGRPNAVTVAEMVRNIALSAALGQETYDFRGYPQGSKELYQAFKQNPKLVSKLTRPGNVILDTTAPIYGTDFNGRNRSVYVDIMYTDENGDNIGFYDVTTSYRDLSREGSRKMHYIEKSGTPEYDRHRMVHNIEEILFSVFGPKITQMGYIPVTRIDYGNAVAKIINMQVKLADENSPIYDVSHSDKYKAEEENPQSEENKKVVANVERNRILQIAANITLRFQDLSAMYGDEINPLIQTTIEEMTELTNAMTNDIQDLRSIHNKLLQLEQSVVDRGDAIEQAHREAKIAAGTLDNYEYKETADLDKEARINATTDEGDLFDACHELDGAFDRIPTFPAANVKTNEWEQFLDAITKVQRIFDTIIIQQGRENMQEGNSVLVVNGVAMPNIEILNKYKNELLLLETAYHTVLANNNPATAAETFRTMGVSDNPSVLLANLLTANDYMQNAIRSVTEDTADRKIRMYYNIANGYVRFVQRLANKVLTQDNKIDDATLSNIRQQIDRANSLVDEINATFILSTTNEFSGNGDSKSEELAKIRNIQTKRRSARRAGSTPQTTDAIHPAFMKMRVDPHYGALTNDGVMEERITGPQVGNKSTIDPQDSRAVVITLVRRNSNTPDTVALHHKYGDNFQNVGFRLEYTDPNTGKRGTIDLPIYNVIDEYKDLTPAGRQQMILENVGNVRFIEKAARALNYVNTYSDSKIRFNVHFGTQGLHYPQKYRDAQGRNVQDFLFKDPLNQHDLYEIIASKESGFGWLQHREGTSVYNVVAYDPSTKNEEVLFYARNKAFRRNTNEGEWHNGYAIYRYKMGPGPEDYVDTALSVAKLGELGADPNKPGMDVARSVTNLILDYMAGEREVDGYDIKRLLNMCLLFRNPTGDYGRVYSEKQWKDHWVWMESDTSGKMTIHFGQTRAYTASQPNEIYKEVASTPMFRNMPLSNFSLREMPISGKQISTLDPIFQRLLSELKPGESRTLPNGLTFDYEDFHHKDSDGDEIGSTMLGWMLRHNVLTSKAYGKSERQMYITDFDIVPNTPDVRENVGDIINDEDVVDEAEIVDEEGNPDDALLFELASDKHKHTDRDQKEIDAFVSRVESIATKLLGKNAKITFSFDIKRDLIERLKLFSAIGAIKPEILGAATTNGIIMSYFAPDSTIYHECFHRLVELILPKEERDRLYASVRGSKNLSNRDIAEALADMYQDFMDGVNELTTAAWRKKYKGVFALIRTVKNMCSNIGCINTARMLWLYGKFNAGKYANKEIANENVNRYNNEFHGILFQKITNPDNGASYSYKYLHDMKDVNDALNGITSIIVNRIFNNGVVRQNSIKVTWNDVCNLIGDKNLDILCKQKIQHNKEDDVKTDKVIGYKNGRPIYYTQKKYIVEKSVSDEDADRRTQICREIFGEYWKREYEEVDESMVIGRQDDQIIYGTHTVQSVNPAFDAIQKILANKIDAQLKGGYSHNALDNDEVDDAAKDNPEKYDKVAYEESKLQDANVQAKLFVSTFPAQRYSGKMVSKEVEDENGKKQKVVARQRVTLKNDLGFATLRTPKEVTNILYEKTKDCRTIDELIDVLRYLSTRSNETIFEIAYERLNNLKIKAYKNKSDHNINIDYDAEQLLASVFQLLTGQTIDFLIAKSRTIGNNGREMNIVHASRDRNRINTSKNWQMALLSGATGVIEQQHTQDGSVVFTKAGGLINNKPNSDMFHRMTSLLKSIRDGLTSKRDTLQNGILRIPHGTNQDGSQKYDEYNIGNVNSVHKLYQDVANYLMRLGIVVSADMLEYVAENDDLLQGDTYADKLGSILNINRDNISAGTFYDSVDAFSTPEGYIDVDAIKKLFAKNGFVKYLANWASEYQASVTDRMVQGIDKKRLFTGSKNSCLSDELSFLNKGAIKDNNYVNTVLNPNQNYTIFNTKDGIMGSIMAKQVYAYRNAKNKKLIQRPNFKLGILHAFRSDRRSDNGAKYSEYSPLQDYMTRFQALQQGYMVFPTPSDKSTYVFISGVDIPGITYEYVRKKGRVATGGFCTYETRDNKLRLKVPDEIINQMYEYAVTEHNQIVKTINDLKTMKDEDKVLNYHISTKNAKYPNGTRFVSFSSVMVPDAHNMSKRRRVYFNVQEGEKTSSEDMLKRADDVFFNVDGSNLDKDGYVVNKIPSDQQREILMDTIEENVNKECERLINLGVIARVPHSKNNQGLSDGERNTQFGYLNILFEGSVIRSIADSYDTSSIRANLLRSSHVSDSLRAQASSESSFSNIKQSLAIKALVADGVIRSTISTQEAFRMFIGNPAFFEITYDKNGLMESYSTDMSKRIGGLMSTGDENMIDEKNDSYTCAIINDTKHPSKSDCATVESNGRSYIENEFIAQARVNTLRRHIMQDPGNLHKFVNEYLPTLSNAALSNEALDLISDKIYEVISDEDSNMINDRKLDVLAAKFNLTNKVKNAENQASMYANTLVKSNTNVTDGSAFVTLDFAKRLLRMRGAYNSDYEKLFKILESTKNEDISKSAEAYKLLHKALNPVNIVATKYTAYGMRSATDGTVVPYYNKYALYVITPGMLYGKLGKLYQQMKDQHVDMLMEASAVKVGVQGAVNVAEDGTFEGGLKPFTQNISLLRRQLNTDPGKSDERAFGTQAIKVALSLIDKHEIYLDQDGHKIRGHQLLSRIMDSINKLSDIGLEKLKKRLYDGNGKISEEKLSKYLIENLSARDASANLLQQFELVDDGRGHKRMRGPIGSSSNQAWVANILKSAIIKNVVDVVTPGTSFVQRSVFAMQGENAVDEKTGLKLYNGKRLQMFNKEKKCMDCAVSIDYFRSIIPSDIKTFEEARQWLIKNKYIGDEADPDTIGYRIPTQAVSSIHALRIVDVVDVVKDTIILPEEFTTITGSDFDIDHLYLATKWKKPDDNQTKLLQNQLIDDILTLLRSSDKFFITQYRSIDNDTSPIKAIADMVPDDNKDTNDPFSFDQLSTQVDKRNQFITGKRGIGPFALNVTQHVLSMLYDVKLSPDSFSEQCGVCDANKMYDDKDVEIMSWLSGFINAHVDIVKDPYISKLNVNTYTYNIISLLTRSGHGGFSLKFTASPVMKILARNSIADGDQLRLGAGDSAKAKRNQSKIALINKLFGYDIPIASIKDGDELLQKAIGFDNDRDFQAYQGQAAEYLMEHENLVEWIIKHPDVDINDNTVIPVYNTDSDNEKSYEKDLEGKDITIKRLNQYIYLANLGFQMEGQKLNALIQHTKVDTRKYGKNLIEQIIYIFQYEKLRSVSGVYDNLDDYLDETWIDKKTKNAIGTLIDVLKNQDLTATNLYRYIIQHLAQDGVSSGQISTFIQNLQTEQVAPYFVKWASNLSKDGDASAYISSLFSGQTSIVNRFSSLLFKMNSTEQGQGYEQYKHLRNNYLLSHLTYSEDDSEEREANQYQFLSLRQDIDEDTMNQDEFTKAWADLLHDDKEDVRDFAKALIVYAFFTSGMDTKWNTLFKYVPTSWKDGSDGSDAESLPTKTVNGQSFNQTYNDYMRDLIDECNSSYPEGYYTVDMIKMMANESTSPNDRSNKIQQLVKQQNDAEDEYSILLAQAGRQVDTYGIIPRVKTSTYDKLSRTSTWNYIPSTKTEQNGAAMYVVSAESALDKQGRPKPAPQFIYITDRNAEGLYQKSGIISGQGNAFYIYTLLPQTGFDDGHNKIYQYGYTLTSGSNNVSDYNYPVFYKMKVGSNDRVALINGDTQIISTLDDTLDKVYRVLDMRQHMPASVFGDLPKNSNQKPAKDEPTIKNTKPTQSNSVGRVGYADSEWSRKSVANDPRTLYIFTDNLDRTSGVSQTADGSTTTQIDPNSKYAKLFITDQKMHGYGSEANPTTAIIRGMDNAMPISTMKHFGPYKDAEQNRWSNDDIVDFMKVIDNEINLIETEWDRGIYTRMMLPKGGFFNTRIANITENTLIGQYLAVKLDQLIKYINAGNKSYAFVDTHDFARSVATDIYRAIKKMAGVNSFKSIVTLTDSRTVKQKGAPISLRVDFRSDLVEAVKKAGIYTSDVSMLKAFRQFINTYTEYIQTGDADKGNMVKKMISSEKSGGVMLRTLLGLPQEGSFYATDEGFKTALTSIRSTNGPAILTLTIVDPVDDTKLTKEEQKRADEAQKQCG